MGKVHKARGAKYNFEHLCGIGETMNRGVCCSNDWKRVTCENCLKWREKLKPKKDAHE
jgi:hypothetical protein